MMTSVATEIRIAPASAGDRDGVVALLEACDLPPAGIEAHFPAAFLVARGDGGGLLGAAGVEIYGDAGLLRSVAVAEAARGRGLGERLTRGAMEMASARGVRDLYLLTTGADGYFPRLGFVRVARESLPASLGGSEQLRGACPATAIAMHRALAAAE
jgi:amino-acid N-acetyltransferase